MITHRALWTAVLTSMLLVGCTSTSSPSTPTPPSSSAASSSSSSQTSSSPQTNSSSQTSSSSPTTGSTQTSGSPPSDSATPTTSSTQAGGSPPIDSATQTDSASSPQSSAAEGTAPPSGPMTSAERVAQLEGMLEASIASYDGMMLREREYALSRSNQKGSEDELEAMDAGGNGGLPYDEAGQAGGSGPEGSRAGGEEEGQDSRDQRGTTASSSGGGVQGPSGQHQSTGAYPPPANIPSGSDDDVVARQIREAAENEPDPVLREKLWEEYRKYKNQ